MSTTTNPALQLNMSQLISRALEAEMERDDRVVVFGEDVGALGGVFGATRNLQRRFGERRVLDTPISEMAFTGLAVGAAQAGLRPVVELMFVDFIGVCLDPVFNQAGKNAYMSGGAVSVPLVLRTAVGLIGAGAQHSQVLSGLFAHLPGLKVVMPGAPGDGPGLLLSALRDPNPVVFLEHKLLLKQRAGSAHHPGAIDRLDEPIPFGQAAIARPGNDVTIATTGWTVQQSVEAATELAHEGIDAEVVDMRTMVPLDRETLISSAARTGRLLVIDEDYLSYGVSGELVAIVCEELWEQRPRVARHALADIPIPASRPLEEAVMPNPRSIADAARRLVQG
jgi:acetoin:2,6-dichlorophenolindophenol oxidoreductase subunit beta